MRLFVLALISPVQAGEVEAGGEGRRGGRGGAGGESKKGSEILAKKKRERKRQVKSIYN